MAYSHTQSLTINIEAYGAIERQLPQNLSLQGQCNCLVSEILAELVQHFPLTAPMLERCACAIGDTIVPRSHVLQTDSTLVLLPPVAGG